MPHCRQYLTRFEISMPYPQNIMCVRMFCLDIFDVRSKNLAAFVLRENFVNNYLFPQN